MKFLEVASSLGGITNLGLFGINSPITLCLFPLIETESIATGYLVPFFFITICMVMIAVHFVLQRWLEKETPVSTE